MHRAVYASDYPPDKGTLRNRALRTAPKNKKDLLPLIRDRECRQLFRSLLPTVPLLADLVEHRSKSDSRASARTAGACASAREPLHPRLRLVPRTVQYRCPRSALGDATLRARCPLPERIPPSTYRVRLDAGQDRCSVFPSDAAHNEATKESTFPLNRAEA